MSIIDNGMLWRQFGAAIDTLGDTLRACPDELWEGRLWEDKPDQWVAAGFSAFWYLGYHTLFWLDLYLYGAEEGFMPPEPFDLVEMEAGETLPRTYSREELLGYLDYRRQKCRETILALARGGERMRPSVGRGAVWELLLYNMRHVQETPRAAPVPGEAGAEGFGLGDAGGVGIYRTSWPGNYITVLRFQPRRKLLTHVVDDQHPSGLISPRQLLTSKSDWPVYPR